MPNWCSTAYAIEGDANELQSLYELMKKLQERKEPSVPNGFGTAWLGCLVDALGEDWEKVFCRGSWYDLEFNGQVLTFSTETAWSPCNETLDAVCKKYPSLNYLYRSEEPGMALYYTNDEEGRYFSDRFCVEVCTSEEEYYTEYFTDLQSVYEWLEKICDMQIQSQQDVDAIVKRWQKEHADAYCYIHEYQIPD